MDERHNTLVCPYCAGSQLSLLNYESLMVLRKDVGLFSLRCPACGNKTTLLRRIPSSLHEEIEFAAIEMGAGMGHPIS